MKIITKVFTVFALLLTSLSVNAAIIAVNYEVTNKNGGGVMIDGLFTGEDSNADNLLTFDELISFSSSRFDIVDLSTLFDTGDFDIVSNLWLNNAISWDGSNNDAWFTWNNRANSVNSQWAVVTSSVVSAVPAPPAVWLFGSGLILLIGVMRKRASKLAISA